MKSLIQRSVTGFIFVTIMGGCILLGGPYLSLLFLCAMILGMWEFFTMFKSSAYQIQKIPSLLAAINLYLYASQIFWNGNLSLVLGLSPMFILIGFMFIIEMYKNTKEPFVNIALSVLPILYIALPFSLLIYIYKPVEGILPSHLLLLGFFILVWVNDTFAYIFGIAFGKHRLFERLSPKKSWEGAIGGCLSTIGIACLYGFLLPEVNVWFMFAFALIIVVFSVFGDLVESMLKRSLNIKDSGNLMPGHGGVLDRFDSILLAAPAVSLFLYLYFNC